MDTLEPIINEYGTVGHIIEINLPDEAVIRPINSRIDTEEYCALSKCRNATKEEITKAFEITD